jgi:hypothetical protein
MIADYLYNTPAPPAGSTVAVVLFATAYENSDADVKIKGGFIPKGTNWKINDFEISLTGGIK